MYCARGQMSTGMNRFRRFRAWKGVILFWFVLMLPAGLYASEPELAPMNPAFIRYQQQMLEGRFQQSQTAEGFSLGSIPAPVDLSHVNAARRTLSQANLPVSYDLRQTGKLPPVRDQGSCGACWTFAAYGSLESYMLPKESWDFSEQDMNQSHGFDPPPCEGGNSIMATAYLARWSGPLTEADVPYSKAAYVTQKHIQKAVFIPNSPYTFSEIKQAIMNGGAVKTTIYMEDTSAAYFNTATNAYYYSGKANTNHDVTIVGWDDAYSKTKFATPPPGDGAFIIRNSWGTGFGDGGYFYMSYYDTYAGNNCWAFHNAEPTDNYIDLYQYDPLGWVIDSGFKTTTGWGANIFQAVSSNPLAAVAFYATDANMQYVIQVYTGVVSGQPTSGTLVLSQSGSVAEVGYHTVRLDQSVALTQGERFSVVVSFTTPTYNYPIPVEMPVQGYSSKATSNPGESFVSSNGTAWQDVSASKSQVNVCIKAFTSKAEPDCITKWVLNNPSTGSISQSELKDVDCVFNGIEALVPEALYPPTQTVAADVLAYRFYSSTVAYLAAWKSGDVKVFYLGPLSNNCPLDLGTTSTLKPIVCTQGLSAEFWRSSEETYAP